MSYTSARFADRDHLCIEAVRGGSVLSIPVDPDNADYAALIEQGLPIAAWQPANDQAAFANAIQGHVDATAQSRGYFDSATLASYAASTVAAWSAEAVTFIAWRDAVWVYSTQELAKVQAGQRPIPTIEGLVAELPVIVWPE